MMANWAGNKECGPKVNKLVIKVILITSSSILMEENINALKHEFSEVTVYAEHWE